MSNELLGTCTRGHVFVVSAPAGTGKTTLVSKLTHEFSDVVLNVSYTTRKPRAGEVHAVHYHFVSDEEFSRMEKNGEFLEKAEHFGNRYGVSKAFVEAVLQKKKHIVFVIDTEGAKNLMGVIEATYIFILPPSKEELKRRLQTRATETGADIEERLSKAIRELEDAPLYEYHIVNDKIERAYQILRSIVIAETHKSN